MKTLLKLASFLLPWSLRRRALNSWFGFQIHPDAWIGWAWIFPKKLVMKAGARINHFTVALHLDAIEMGEKARIGRSNWITGLATGGNSPHFRHQPDRQARLEMGSYAAITKKHHLDCTNLIRIGAYATIAGYHSQLLTHQINLEECRQDSSPIIIGDYTMIGTDVTILGGAVLPSYAVLGAKSMLNKAYTEAWMLYGGVPARPIKPISKDALYFHREIGFVY